MFFKELTYRLNQDIPIGVGSSNTNENNNNIILDPYRNNNNNNTQYANVQSIQTSSNQMLIGMNTNAELTESVWWNNKRFK